MRPKLNHIWISIIISLILSLITIIATYMFDNWSIRHIYNIFFMTFLNFTILFFSVTLLTKHPKFLKNKMRKFLRIMVMVLYSTIYLISTISFLTTGQIIRTQGIIFISGANPILINTIAITIIAIIIILITLLFYKKINIPEAEPQDRKNLKKVLYISGILLAITVLINTTYLNINEDIITDYDALINYQSEEIILSSVFSENITFGKPNVILILLETLSAERMGAYGYEKNTTPNIDRLAENSLVFTNAYTTSTHSDYAQPGLLSSRYMFSYEDHGIPTESSPRKFIWDIFKEDDYTTGYYSSQDDKWQDMDLYLNYENLDNFSYSRTDGKTDYGAGLAQKDYDHKTAALAIQWLNETTKKQDPFFLYLNFQATHLPRSYPEEYNYFGENSDQEKYDNALRYVDIQVGKIINFLEENNLTDNTIIAITSDHGEDLENRHEISNHGKSIYNEELIVPAIIKIPGLGHEVIEEKVSHIDFVPTLIHMLGYPIPKEFQGNVMLKNRPIFFVTQSHKYLIGMIENDTKVILDLNRDLSEIYNLEDDPNEINQLKSKEYSNEILKLLLWSYCQKNYYSKETWKDYSENRCTRNNNFKI